jgi:superfamily II DNA or RNA helicase
MQTVYRISQRVLDSCDHAPDPRQRAPSGAAIFPQTRTYPTVVVSHVLNEGVDVPEAAGSDACSRVRVLPASTFSDLGRILRKGSGCESRRLLYEVIAEETSEEGVARRRRAPSPRRQSGQLELVTYGNGEGDQGAIAAESSPPWPEPEF